MKKLPLTLALVPMMILFFSSCLKDECIELREFTTYIPIYLDADSFRVDITISQHEQLENAGKIFLYGDLLLINDINKGIHVVDNRNPAQPNFVNFIGITGNVDMVMAGNYLYADSYSDLLTIDVSDWMNPKLIAREKNVFNLLGWMEEGLLVGYEEHVEILEVDCHHHQGSFNAFWDGSAPFSTRGSSFDSFLPSSAPSGIAGSMARMGIASGHLYGIDNRSLHVFDLENPALPERVNEVKTAWGIETLFPYNEYLFIGGNRGMYIYDNQTPSSPVYLAEFNHANACDPVFVSGNRAYVTLRDGVNCVNASNQLDVIDISNIKQPRLLKSYPMTNPHGLSIVNSTLFLCDGRDGLKIFDISNDYQIDRNKLSHTKFGHTYDVIARSENHIIVTGDGGIRQFDTFDPRQPIEISFLSINNQ